MESNEVSPIHKHYVHLARVFTCYNKLRQKFEIKIKSKRHMENIKSHDIKVIIKS